MGNFQYSRGVNRNCYATLHRNNRRAGEAPIHSARIYPIRGQTVMIDFELADLYQVPTKALNQAVRRNLDRFPADFMFVDKRRIGKLEVTICDLRFPPLRLLLISVEKVLPIFGSGRIPKYGTTSKGICRRIPVRAPQDGDTSFGSVGQVGTPKTEIRGTTGPVRENCSMEALMPPSTVGRGNCPGNCPALAGMAVGERPAT